uniref:Uncharacterized protein n=1 Tax=Parascaris univalens TaxID=6257 RepID=A0A914ZJC9_PARUN
EISMGCHSANNFAVCIVVRCVMHSVVMNRRSSLFSLSIKKDVKCEGPVTEEIRLKRSLKWFVGSEQQHISATLSSAHCTAPAYIFIGSSINSTHSSCFLSRYITHRKFLLFLGDNLSSMFWGH